MPQRELNHLSDRHKLLFAPSNIIVPNFKESAVIFSLHRVILEQKLSARRDRNVIAWRSLHDLKFYSFETASDQESVILSHWFVSILEIGNQKVLGKRARDARNSVPDRLAVDLLSFFDISKWLNFNVVAEPDSEVVSDNFIHPYFLLLELVLSSKG